MQGEGEGEDWKEKRDEKLLSGWNIQEKKKFKIK